MEQSVIAEVSDNKSDAICPAPAAADSILGKFANPEELAKAYSALESEFTRKSQRLSELERAQIEKPNNAGAADIKQVQVIETAPQTQDYSKSGEIIREQIITEYLTSLANKKQAPTVITAANGFAYGAKSEPKSIRDVAHVAEDFFRAKAPILD